MQEYYENLKKKHFGRTLFKRHFRQGPMRLQKWLRVVKTTCTVFNCP